MDIKCYCTDVMVSAHCGVNYALRSGEYIIKPLIRCLSLAFKIASSATVSRGTIHKACLGNNQRCLKNREQWSDSDISHSRLYYF